MAGWTYIIHVDTSARPFKAEMGHAYIEIKDPSGKTIERAGYYPNTESPDATGAGGSLGDHIKDAPGIVDRDDTHDSDFHTDPKEISPDTAQKMIDHIKWVEKNPGTYGIADNNCVEFVEDLMRIAGDRSSLNDAIAPFQLAWDLQIEAYIQQKIRDAERIWDSISDWFRTAINPPRRDPLAIDLDSDGIETVGIGNVPIMFDHDGDGTKNATGWLKPDDAWLVLDRNGNGLIDSGRELFGVDTLITVNGVVLHAANGFQALGAEGNSDNAVFDQNDASFSRVRLWQDINQDGISQANELSTLASKGITSINLFSTDASANLGNGNTITAKATVTREGNSNIEIDTVSLSGSTANNLDLAFNPFYRIFTDSIALTETARKLPDMGGSGTLRDLREAMSLVGNPAANTLTQKVAQFSVATTRDAQLEVIDQILQNWADTGTIKNSQSEKTQGHVSNYDYRDFLNKYSPLAINPITENTYEAAQLVGEELLARGILKGFLQGPLDQWTQKNSFDVWTQTASEEFLKSGDPIAFQLDILSKFNGAPGFDWFLQPMARKDSISSFYISVPNQARDLITLGYASLRECVYGALARQTRLRPYFNAIDLVIDEDGIRLDFSKLTAKLETYKTSDQKNALIDLIELNRYAQDILTAVGFDGMAKLRNWVDGLPTNSPLHTILSELRVLNTSPSIASEDATLFLGDSGNSMFHAGSSQDILDGGGGNDVLYGGGGSDWLYGRNGQDQLSGDGGNDTLDGGTGNDQLFGGAGSDLYLFGKGSGHDIISNSDVETHGTTIDTVLLGSGIAASNVALSRHLDDLVMQVIGTDDNLTISGYFKEDGFSSTDTPVLIKFEDGATWDLPTVKAKVLASTSGNDWMAGFATHDTLNGGDGNDALSGREGNDLLLGGSGSDQLVGDGGNDTLDGGSGNDFMSGGEGADTYLFGRTSGRDVIRNWDYGGMGNNHDVLLLATGIASTDVILTQNFNDLFIKFNDTDDSLQITDYFYQDGASANKLEFIKFANGSNWDYATVKSKLATFTPSPGITITGTAAPEALNGGLADDVLVGNGGNDTLTGGPGNDLLDGGQGNDTYLFGKGAGRDVISSVEAFSGKVDTVQLAAGILSTDLRLTREGDALKLVISGTADSLEINNYFAGDATAGYQVEQIKFAGGPVWTVSDVKAKVLTATSIDDNLTGYATADLINGLAGNDELHGRVANDSMDGGAGDDRLFGEDGDDKLLGGTQDDYLDGGLGQDALSGQDGNDTLLGGANHDTLDGGLGNDFLDGGDGNDVYVFGKGSGGDTINNTDYQAGKVDILQLGAGISPADILVQRGGDSLLLTIKGSGDSLSINQYFSRDATDGHQIERIEFVDGTSWSVDAVKARVMVPTSDNDNITGYAVNDLMAGLGGDDLLQGQNGNDTLDGGNDDDTLKGDAGNDQLLGGAQDDRLLGGDGNDLLMGSTGNDDLSGDSGSDTLDGGIGRDLLQGGPGNDTYVFGKGFGQDFISDYDQAVGKLDVIQLAPNTVPADVLLQRNGTELVLSLVGASDTLIVSDYFTLYDNPNTTAYPVDQIKFTDGTTWDTAAIKAKVLAPTEEDDLRVGYASADMMAGGPGNDRLEGLRGNDTLDGGQGNDWLAGGEGNDVIVFASGSGADTVSAYDNTSGKTDVLQWLDVTSTELTSLNRQANDLVLRFGQDDQVSIQNQFAGSAYRIDQFKFSDGIIIDDATIEAMTQATVVQGTEGPNRFTRLAGSTLLHSLGGNDSLAGSIEDDFLYGGSGDDGVAGNAGNDLLYGEAGSDTLTGGSGLDTLVGGYGGDTYYLSEVGDLVIENATPGEVDQVISSVSYAMPTGVESLALQGSENLYAHGHDSGVNIFGNYGSNEIRGGASNDILDGGDGGADTLIGGLGDDIYSIYDGDGAPTTMIEAANGGHDQVWAYSSDITLPNHLEDAFMKYSEVKANFIGNSGANRLVGGDVSDTLRGMAGNDSLEGGKGDDTYAFDRGDGLDLITDYDTTAGNLDRLLLGTGIKSAQLWFAKAGVDLQISLIGTTDGITVRNWYATRPGSRIEAISAAGDQKSLTPSKVDALVNAMAGFTPPTAVAANGTPVHVASVANAIAANWQ